MGASATASARDPPSVSAESDAGDGRAHALTFAVRAGNSGYGGMVGYRLRLRRGIGVGVEVEGVFAPRSFIGGYATGDNVVVAGRLPLFFPVYRSRALTMAVTFAPGLYSVRSFSPDQGPSAGLSVTADVGVFAYLRVGPRLTWMAGVDNPVSVQLGPIVDVNKVGTLVSTGPVVPINERLSWFATAQAGGLFGSGGDAGKFLMRGTTGLRLVFGASARQWIAF